MSHVWIFAPKMTLWPFEGFEVIEFTEPIEAIEAIWGYKEFWDKIRLLDNFQPQWPKESSWVGVSEFLSPYHIVKNFIHSLAFFLSFKDCGGGPSRDFPSLFWGVENGFEVFQV